jgi:hypothetical protein
VDHHIEPVTAGVRLTVAYDVFVTDPFKFTASSLDPSTVLFGEQLSKALGHSDFLSAGGTVGFALSHAYPVCADGGNFKTEYPKLLKCADAVLYYVALSLGLEVQLRAVYEIESYYLGKEFLDTEKVTFVDDFGPYAMSTERADKSAPPAQERDVPIKTVDDLVNEVEGGRYPRDLVASASVFLTSTEASGEALDKYSGCVTVEEEDDEEIREILKTARAKVEQNVVWVRRPNGRTKTQAGSSIIAMGNQVRTMVIPVCLCSLLTSPPVCFAQPYLEWTYVSAALFLIIPAFKEGVRGV